MKGKITVSDASSYRPGQLVAFYTSSGKLRGPFYVSKILSETTMRIRLDTWFWRLFFRIRAFFS
jgi:hypothetical protein